MSPNINIYFSTEIKRLVNLIFFFFKVRHDYQNIPNVRRKIKEEERKIAERNLGIEDAWQ